MKKPCALLAPMLGLFFFACSIVKAGDVPEIFEYMPSSLMEVKIPDLYGCAIHFIDFSKIRKELKLPEVTGGGDVKLREEFISGLRTQGLEYTPDSISPHVVWAFKARGWDVADLSQTLYCPKIRTTILQGDFKRPQIKKIFEEDGYKEIAKPERFVVFSKESGKLYYALAPDTLIIGPQLEIIMRIIEQKKNPQGSLSQHLQIKKFFNLCPDIFGSIVLSSGDFETYSKEIHQNSLKYMSRDLMKKLGMNPDKPDLLSYEWDKMAIFFNYENDKDILCCYYIYPSEEKAKLDMEYARKFLTEELSSPNQKQTLRYWTKLKDIKVKENILCVELTTEHKSLLGNAFSMHSPDGIYRLLLIKTEKDAQNPESN